MSFRCKQKFHTCPCSGVGVVESVTLETGVIETHVEDACTKEMPDAELFDLETNLKAGVNIEEVGSKILGGSQVDIPLDALNKELDDKNKKSTEINNEVNNEN